MECSDIATPSYIIYPYQVISEYLTFIKSTLPIPDTRRVSNPDESTASKPQIPFPSSRLADKR